MDASYAPNRRALMVAAGAAAGSSILPVAATAHSAPGFPGIDAWINSGPLSMGGLRGRPVLVTFWTRQCINCLHALPYIKSWYAKYHGRGFTVVGVHTPEFEVEKSLPALRAAVASHGIAYPVAQDNQSTTWNAWGNQYWPAEYLIDRKGGIIHVHTGEGGYGETEQLIQSALG